MKALKALKIPAVPSSASGQGSQNAGAGEQMNPEALVDEKVLEQMEKKQWNSNCKSG